MRILSDLTQPTLPAQVPAKRMYISISDDGDIMPQNPYPNEIEFVAGQDRASFAQREAQARFWDNPGREPRERASARPRAFYRPVSGSGPLYCIMDRVHGQALARVWGTWEHVFNEATKLAQSQGGSLRDLKIVLEG